MTLDPATWLEQAQALTLGQRRRVDHDCGSGRTMVVKHGDNGFDAYCWRCSDKGFHPHPQPSMAERLARLTQVRQADAEAERDVRPPMPAEFDPALWPLHAKVWLYKAGFSNDTIRQIGAYYCGRLDRVVLPVMAGDRLVYWQARGFNADTAKYINPPIDKAHLAAVYGSAGPLVVTEDVLSAARVGQVATGFSILGTALSDAVASRIAALRPSRVFVWLDPDGAGVRARAKVRQKLVSLGVDARIIRSDRDPKLYSDAEIRTWLEL